MIAHALKASDLYPPLEGILLVLVTAATSFLGYEVIRRIALLRPLFGLERTLPRLRKAAADLAVPAAPRLVHD